MADFELLAPGGHQELVDEVLDRLDTKADYDGYYAQLTAGAADSLTGRGDGVSASYLCRTTGGDADVADGTATVKSIHGRTVVWNQMNNNSSTSVDAAGITRTIGADGSQTVNGTCTRSGNVYIMTHGSNPNFVITKDHKYLFRGCPAGGSASTYAFTLQGSIVDTGNGGIYLANANIEAPNFLFHVVEGVTFNNVTFYPQLFDLTAMFGAGNEPSTVAEFEALFPEPYYPYDAGSLLSVQMEGIETVGFNQWNEEWEVGSIAVATGQNIAENNAIRSKNYSPCFPDTEYYIKSTTAAYVFWYRADKSYISNVYTANSAKTSPSGAAYFRVRVDGTTTYNNDICINLSWSGYRNGEYEPFWKSERTIPATTYFPNGMRSAGSVYDELTSEEAVTRVGAVDLGTLTWQVNDNCGGYRAFYTSALRSVIAPHTSYGTVANIWCSALAVKSRNELYESSADGITQSAQDITCRYDGATTAAEFKAAMSGVMLHYALATPTVAPIDPPLNLSYKVSDFGTERIMHTDPTAAPTQQVVYGLNVVDTVRRLPTEYISHDSFTQFRIALATFLGATITESWDETDNRYEYAITQNGE